MVVIAGLDPAIHRFLQNVFAKKMDARVISAFTRVFDALLPAHDPVVYPSWNAARGLDHRSSTSRSLLQPAQQIMTLVFEACSSSVRMASRCSGVPEITRCSQAPQILSSQE